MTNDELVANVLMMRSQLFQQLFDPRRDIYDECGYPPVRSNAVNPQYYRDLFDREPIPNRVVSLYPTSCWQVTPSVFESEDPDEVTDFEEDWDALGQSLRPEMSWYQDEKGSPIWDYLKRADIMSGVGSFGIILLGIDDGKNLEQPVDGVMTLDKGKSFVKNRNARLTWNNGRATLTYGRTTLHREVPSATAAQTSAGTSPMDGTDGQYVGVQLGPPQYADATPSAERRRLLYMRVFDESLVQVVQYEANIANPRFGQPVMYLVTLNDPREQHSGVGLPIATVRVHWSRVVHLAETRLSSEIFGVPRMRPVLNRLLDLVKLYGGSAEMYWRGAFPGYTLETQPSLGGDVNVDVKATKDMMENWSNGLQRYLILMGMTLKGQAPQVVDPTAQINVQIEAICIQLGCPIRVFKGSERGELASAQDDDAWLDNVRERQNNYVTPRVVIPLIDRLISMGVLREPGKRRTDNAFGAAPAPAATAPPKPKIGKVPEVPDATGFSVEWPSLDSLGKKDKAAICLQNTQAIAAYVAGDVEALVPPMHFLTSPSFMDLSEEEARAILTDAQEAGDDAMTIPPMGEPGHPATAPEPPKPPKPADDAMVANFLELMS